MNTKLILYKGNVMTLVLTDVHDEDTNTKVTGDTVTVSFFTPSGNAVPNYSNLQMTEVSGAPGNYAYIIPKTFDLEVGSYDVVFKGTDFTQNRELEVRNR